MPVCPTPGCGCRLSDNDTVCPDCGTELRRSEGARVSGASAVPVETPELRRSGVRPMTGEPPGSRASTEASARLTLKRAGALTQIAFAVGERAIVGRHDIETGPVDVDLSSLRDDSVSRQHAEIWRDRGGQWRIRDLGSKNGTFLQPPGQRKPLRIERGDSHALYDGDDVVLGGPRFEFRVEGDGC
jgi:FHA domain